MLWSKLANYNIDPRLLFLIKSLYSDTSSQIKLNSQGNLSEPFHTNKGVKQGCVLAPTLFNLFLNDLSTHLASIDSHCPKLNQRPVPLLYANDMVLLSQTRVGLKRLINSCIQYLILNDLQLNFSKSKILVFEKSWKLRTWIFQGRTIQQVKSIKYLGLTFQYKLSWVPHRIAAIKSAKLTSQSILRFFFLSGNQNILAATRIFNAKVRAQLLYGIPIWRPSSNIDVERIQSTFLYKIFGLAHYVPYTALSLEAGQYRLEHLAWCYFVKFWLKVCYNAGRAPLLQELLADSWQSPGFRCFIEKLRSIGFSPQLLGNYNLSATRRLVIQRLYDIESQVVNAAAAKFCSPLTFQLPLVLGHRPCYLALVHDPQKRRMLTLACCNAFPTRELKVRFCRQLLLSSKCTCSLGTTETLTHILFYCPFYNNFRIKHLSPLLNNLKHLQDNDIIRWLLTSNNVAILNQVSSFLTAVLKKRRSTTYIN